MALVNGTTQLGFRYITSARWNEASTAEAKQALLNHLGEVIFIEATNQLYVPTDTNVGTYFGLTDTQKANLTSAYNEVVTGGAGTIKNKVADLETRVGTTTALSQTLLAIAEQLKSKLDGGSYSGEGTAGETIAVTKTVEGQQVTCTNVVDAVNELFSRVTSAVSGVSSVNGATGAVVLKGSDIEVSANDSTKIDVALGNKVAITSTDASNATNTGKKDSDYTTTKVIGDAIEAAHAAAVAADTAAGNKIAKSSGAASTLAGDSNVTLTPANLTNADAIVTELVTAYNTLVGTGTHNGWGENEKKTLGTLRDLIATLRTDLTTLSNAVGTLSDADFASITDAINKIKAELNDPANGSLVTFLDTVKTITGGAVVSGANAGKYETKSGTGGASEYATNLGQIITNLEKEIAAAKDAASAAGVTSITEGNGITVSGSTGNVTINATSGAKTTAALTQSQAGYGATTVANSTIQTALQDINDAASSAGKAANDANTAAGAAQTSANNALNQLKWIVD